MKWRIAFPLFFLLLAFSIATLTAQNNAGTPRKVGQNRPRGVEMEVRDADIQWSKDAAARRIEGWMDGFTDDATVVAAGRTIEGKQAIRDFYSPIFSDKDFTLSWAPTRVETSTEGTLGYTYGNYETRVGASVRHGMYVTIWRKVEGKWKVALDIGSPLPAPPPGKN